MARQKKEGTHISFYLDSSILERLRAYADDKGQTVTLALERLLTKSLDEEGFEVGTQPKTD